MKVSLAVHGGLAAAIHLRRPPLVVDTAALSGNETRELAELVAAAKDSPPGAEERRQGAARDAMSYTITVEDGGTPAILHQSDTRMSPEFTSLLGWLQQHSPDAAD